MKPIIDYVKIHRGKYKYLLKTTYRILLPEIFYDEVESSHEHNGFYYLSIRKGWLQISKGYAWDGPSGPTIDTENWMRASLVHDALYQLMRERVLDLKMRLPSDNFMYSILRQDEMSWIRAVIAWKIVRWFGESSARPV